jgi:hypothetical protein
VHARRLLQPRQRRGASARLPRNNCSSCVPAAARRRQLLPAARADAGVQRRRGAPRAARQRARQAVHSHAARRRQLQDFWPRPLPRSPASPRGRRARSRQKIVQRARGAAWRRGRRRATHTARDERVTAVEGPGGMADAAGALRERCEGRMRYARQCAAAALLAAAAASAAPRAPACTHTTSTRTDARAPHARFARRRRRRCQRRRYTRRAAPHSCRSAAGARAPARVALLALRRLAAHGGADAAAWPRAAE